MDPRLSNTASQADYWLPTYPGSEAAVLLAMAKILLDEGLADLEYLEAWTNWREYLADRHPGEEPTFARFLARLREHYREFTPEFAEAESGVPRDKIVTVARGIGAARGAFASHVWRGTASGNLGRLAGGAGPPAPDRAHGQRGHARAAPRPTPGTSTSPPSGRSRRPSRSGTSCSSRRSGRSATTR